MYINTSPVTKKPAKMLAKERELQATRAKLRDLNSMDPAVRKAARSALHVRFKSVG